MAQAISRLLTHKSYMIKCFNHGKQEQTEQWCSESIKVPDPSTTQAITRPGCNLMSTLSLNCMKSFHWAKISKTRFYKVNIPLLQGNGELAIHWGQV